MAVAQQKAKKPNVFKRLGSFFVKSWSELKKVTWPTFRTVLKNLGIVLLVTLVFAVIILIADMIFANLLISLPGGNGWVWPWNGNG